MVPTGRTSHSPTSSLLWRSFLRTQLPPLLLLCAWWPVPEKRTTPDSISSSSGSLSPPPAPPGCKRFRLSPPQLSSPAPSIADVAPAARALPPFAQASDQVSNHSTHLHPPDSSTSGHHVNPKLAIYKDNLGTERPEILITGDSIVRFVRLPGAITYCLSGGKTADFTELIPALLNIHPTVHTVICHTGTCNVTGRQSIKLHYDLESLATTIESLGRRCVLSGPTPVMSKGSERFSRLFSLHQWLENFTTATGLGFISHFDSFWTKREMFRPDGLHLNRKGTGQLTQNLINFVAFNCH